MTDQRIYGPRRLKKAARDLHDDYPSNRPKPQYIADTISTLLDEATRMRKAAEYDRQPGGHAQGAGLLATVKRGSEWSPGGRRSPHLPVVGGADLDGPAAGSPRTATGSGQTRSRWSRRTTSTSGRCPRPTDGRPCKRWTPSRHSSTTICCLSRCSPLQPMALAMECGESIGCRWGMVVPSLPPLLLHPATKASTATAASPRLMVDAAQGGAAHRGRRRVVGADHRQRQRPAMVADKRSNSWSTDSPRALRVRPATCDSASFDWVRVMTTRRTASGGHSGVEQGMG